MFITTSSLQSRNSRNHHSLVREMSYRELALHFMVVALKDGARYRTQESSCSGSSTEGTLKVNSKTQILPNTHSQKTTHSKQGSNLDPFKSVELQCYSGSPSLVAGSVAAELSPDSIQQIREQELQLDCSHTFHILATSLNIPSPILKPQVDEPFGTRTSNIRL